MKNNIDKAKFLDYFGANSWNVNWSETRPSREAVTRPINDLGLHKNCLNSLKTHNSQVYVHQYSAISSFLLGENVAVTTPTASGKTLVFNTCALDLLSKKTDCRVAAIYPLKALASEQAERWRISLRDSELGATVGRIDGDVPTSERLRIIKNNRVIVLTPDIIHAWLFSNISNPTIQEFLRNLSLVILDEAHTYAGVFGSNSAYLFRRLIHATRKLGGNIRFIASSATMDNPENHLELLTGESFTIVGPELDSSPQSEVETLFVTPPKGIDMLTVVSDLIHFSVTNTDRQSITFVDSRKQTEYLATILDRKLRQPEEDEEDHLDLKMLRDLHIYPYRSGYEADDRHLIHRQLAAGKLRGVVSTSALEMGIDLPYLNLGIIQGIPRSATSYYQRVGRIGRKKEGIVIVVNNGSVVSETIFNDPSRIKNLPLVQSALYLQNPRIQYIHAMCLARHGGEDEIISNVMGQDSDPLVSPITLPQDFIKICVDERTGELSSEFQTMKSQAGDDPYHTFPLRDLDTQFRVEHRQGPNVTNLGALSFGQVMREAYPGAVYYYQTRAYRVTRVKKAQRTIETRIEKRYFTTPEMLPILILPNLTADNIYEDIKLGSLRVVESMMQIGEAVVGFKERRGNNESIYHYPLASELGFFFDQQKFARYVFTSGVLFDHPALSNPQVKTDAIAHCIYEAFLMVVPFEPQDISFGADKHRSKREGIEMGNKFVCIFDQTYGSLRLTSRLMEEKILREVLSIALEIAQTSNISELNFESICALQEMVDESQNQPIRNESKLSIHVEGQYGKVIKPGSYGININKDNEEFLVEGIFFSPQFAELAYRGKHANQKRRAELENIYHGATSIIVPAKHIEFLEGISELAYYNYETGELLENIPADGEF